MREEDSKRERKWWACDAVIKGEKRKQNVEYERETGREREGEH